MKRFAIIVVLLLAQGWVLWIKYRPIPSILAPHHILPPAAALCPLCVLYPVSSGTVLTTTSVVCWNGIIDPKFGAVCISGVMNTGSAGASSAFQGGTAECDDTVNYTGDDVCYQGPLVRAETQRSHAMTAGWWVAVALYFLGMPMTHSYMKWVDDYVGVPENNSRCHSSFLPVWPVVVIVGLEMILLNALAALAEKRAKQ